MEMWFSNIPEKKKKKETHKDYFLDTKDNTQTTHWAN